MPAWMDWHWIWPLVGLCIVVATTTKWFRETYGKAIVALTFGVVLIVIPFIPFDEFSGGELISRCITMSKR